MPPLPSRLPTDPAGRKRTTTRAATRRRYLGIDPGASGGLALVGQDGGRANLVSMPDTPRDLWKMVDYFRDHAVTHAVLEANAGFVGGAGNPGSAMFKFGRSHGLCEMALTAAGIPFELVQPQVWQKALGVPRRRKGKGKAGESKAQFKGRLKALAQRLFPWVEVTLKTCDALLLAHYCRLKQEGRLAR